MKTYLNWVKNSNDKNSTEHIALTVMKPTAVIFW